MKILAHRWQCCDSLLPDCFGRLLESSDTEHNTAAFGTKKGISRNNIRNEGEIKMRNVGMEAWMEVSDGGEGRRGGMERRDEKKGLRVWRHWEGLERGMEGSDETIYVREGWKEGWS
jgi:hypothetical protein